MSAQVSHKRSTGKEGMSAQILIIPHHLVRNEDELLVVSEISAVAFWAVCATEA